METKALIKKLSLIATIFLVLIGAGLIYWLYTVIYATPLADNSKSQQVKVNYDLYTKMENPPSYGSSVTPQETGYGRPNPFAEYKAPPAPPADATATATGTPVPTATPAP